VFNPSKKNLVWLARHDAYGVCAIIFYLEEIVSIYFFLVDQIIYMSWFWFINRLRININLTFSR
jgi:hypothetical protein